MTVFTGPVNLWEMASAKAVLERRKTPAIKPTPVFAFIAPPNQKETNEKQGISHVNDRFKIKQKLTKQNRTNYKEKKITELFTKFKVKIID